MVRVGACWIISNIFAGRNVEAIKKCSQIDFKVVDGKS